MNQDTGFGLSLTQRNLTVQPSDFQSGRHTPGDTHKHIAPTSEIQGQIVDIPDDDVVRSAADTVTVRDRQRQINELETMTQGAVLRGS